MLVWLTCIMKWWPQLVQLISIFSREIQEKLEGRRKEKRKRFSSCHETPGFTLLTLLFINTGSHPVRNTPSTYWSCNWSWYLSTNSLFFHRRLWCSQFWFLFCGGVCSFKIPRTSEIIQYWSDTSLSERPRSKNGSSVMFVCFCFLMAE